MHGVWHHNRFTCMSGHMQFEWRLHPKLKAIACSYLRVGLFSISSLKPICLQQTHSILLINYVSLKAGALKSNVRFSNPGFENHCPECRDELPPRKWWLFSLPSKDMVVGTRADPWIFILNSRGKPGWVASQLCSSFSGNTHTPCTSIPCPIWGLHRLAW